MAMVVGLLFRVSLLKGETVGLVEDQVCDPAAEYLDWRWTMYVNVIFAVVAFVGGAALLHRTPRDTTSKLDVPSTLLASIGLFCLVYGFSNAETHGWGSVATWGCRQSAPYWWPSSPGGRTGRRLRCCPCGSCWTVTAAPPSPPSSSPAQACSTCSCS
ncbi:hypothetical protein [Streptomyces sp. NPDC048665]|uniref:hypothetical protein n=1 Tax=Streptomyces sp. NPDC048665 TaxID=3155490 RepID=UPI0034135F00